MTVAVQYNGTDPTGGDSCTFPDFRSLTRSSDIQSESLV